MHEGGSYYDTLELSPDASANEIREAYLRLKSAYGRDSMAAYSLISSEETEAVVRQIEEAFQVLSHPEKRREYDRHYKVVSKKFTMPTPPPPPVPRSSNVVSIDRTPPMSESLNEMADLEALMTPRTDDTARDPIIAESAPLQKSPQVRKFSPERISQLESSGEWTGPVLREIREALGMSLEEIAELTRISKTYLIAIENDHFAKLPASVFVRGFVSQIAKILSLPHERVANAYVARYRQSGLGRT